MTDTTEELVVRAEAELTAGTIPPDPMCLIRAQTVRELIDALEALTAMTKPERYPLSWWTESLRDICREACAYPYGEPPCWQDVDGSPPVGPCWSCYNEWREGLAND